MKPMCDTAPPSANLTGDGEIASCATARSHQVHFLRTCDIFSFLDVCEGELPVIAARLHLSCLSEDRDVHDSPDTSMPLPPREYALYWQVVVPQSMLFHQKAELPEDGRGSPKFLIFLHRRLQVCQNQDIHLLSVQCHALWLEVPPQTHLLWPGSRLNRWKRKTAESSKDGF